MKTSNDTIGNRTRNLSACSAVPQPTALARAPKIIVVNVIINRATDAGLECLPRTSVDGSKLFVRTRWLTNTVVTQDRGLCNI